MKNLGYLDLSSSEVLISERGSFCFLPAHPSERRVGVLNLLSCPRHSFFQVWASGDGPNDVPQKKEMSFGSGHNINKWGQGFENLPDPLFLGVRTNANDKAC